LIKAYHRPFNALGLDDLRLRVFSGD
jgi:hypothetical protein